ncbi:MAG: RsbRD N-terminal domain-containing protein [Cyanobacteria bacterium P01_A01_bin.135]
MNFSEILDAKRESIVEQWINAVFADRQIEVTDELSLQRSEPAEIAREYRLLRTIIFPAPRDSYVY